MKTNLALLFAVLIPIVAQAADDLSTALQKGLFEEEANQNLSAAIKAYESLLATSDDQRKLAATALFRLGECYRKLGRTNDAVAQYQRLLRDYTEQQTLATLSRQNLVGLGVSRATATTPNAQGDPSGMSTEARARLKDLLQNEIKIAEQFAAEQRKRIDAGTLPLGDAVRYERDVLGLKRQLVAVDGLSLDADRNEWRTLLMQELKLAEDAVRMEQKKFENGRSTASEVARLQRDVLILKRELITFDSAPQAAAPPRSTTVRSVESDELERTERILAQLEGWDLGQVRRILPTLVPDADFERYDRLLAEAQEKVRDSAGLERDKWQRAANENAELLARRFDEVKRILQDRVDRLRTQIKQQTAIPQVQSEAAKAAALFKQLESLNRTELVRVLPTVAPDALLTTLLEQRSQAERKLAELETTFAKDHPNMKAAQASLRHLDEQIAERVEGIMKGLEIKAAAFKQSSPRSAGPTEPSDEEQREIRRIQALIKNSPDLINAVNVEVGVWNDRPRHGTPLHKAAQQGQLVVARFLIDNRADIESRDFFGRTPLHWAAMNGHKSMVELLLSRRADPNARVNAGSYFRDFGGFTPLHLAAQNGYRNVCEALIDGKADLNIKSDFLAVTPLHLASDRGFTSVAELLLSKRAEVDARDAEDSTPLMLAAKAGMKNAVQLLLTNKADINAQNSKGESPLFSAVNDRRTEVARVLLENKANPNLTLNENAKDHAGWTPLSAAVSNKDVPMARLLLHHGANPNAIVGTQGWTVLMSAALHGLLELAEALVNAGADVNALNGGDAHATALYYVTKQDPTNAAALVNLLLTNKAEVNAADADGVTPLINAVLKRNAEVVKLLVDHGGDVNLMTKRGNSPLSLIKGGRQPGQGQVGSATPPVRLPKPSVGGRVSRQPDSTDPTPEIVALLEKHGARDDLQRLAHISTSRNLEDRRPWFFKGTNDWNHYTLLELIAWINPGPGRNTGVDFPDLARVAISRIDPKTAKTEDFRVNLAAALTNSECAEDQLLQWGDIVDIPEQDHFVDARWDRYPDAYFQSFQKCLERTVRVSIKGQTNTIVLRPFQQKTSDTRGLLPGATPLGNPWESRMGNFRLNGFLRNSGLLLTSSDMTRVTVKRTDPISKKVRNRVFDLDQINQRNDDANDLWLQDGDVIEVPEKP